jgi:predicted outer membrane repeat protein
MSALLLSLLLVCVAGAGTIYVDEDATGANNGSSWEDAFNYLQDALADANSNPDVNEIWVAAGIYTPDSNSAIPEGSADREATFQLINGVALYGGFPSGGSAWEERDPNAYETILSGDLDGNDVDVNDARDLPGEPTRAENSYHVVTSIANEEATLLDGFTITGGNAYYNPHWEGGGVYLLDSRVRIMNCIISGNKAYRGGGIHCLGGSPTMSRCTVIGNVAGTENSSDSRGGGILCSGGSPAVTECIINENFALGEDAEGGGIYGCTGPISNCTITGNWVEDRGGGLAFCSGPIRNCTISNNTAQRDTGGLCGCDGPIINCTISGNCAQQEDTGGLGECDGPITNCIITGNWAARDAGAMGSCDGTITNCIITGNWAGRYGGAVRNVYYGPTLTNCTVSGNSAVRRGGAIYMRRSTLVLTNCIFSFNAASEGNEIALMWYSTMDVKYCDVAGGQMDIYIDSTSTINWGQGNIDADPCFADVDSNDYRLRPGSPCVDAGDNDSVPADTADLDGDGNMTEPIPWDLDGNRRIVDGNNDGNAVVDMGAYEYFVAPIEVAMRFTPQALNPGSQGKWVKAHFVLPEEYTVSDVDVNSPAKITEPFEPNIDSNYIDVFINESDLVEVEAAFERGVFCEADIGDEAIEVTVVGSFTSGQQFYGTDTIKVTTSYLKHLGILASYWLEQECDKPDWCEGTDLDQDSVVDFVDLALFDGCCIEVVGE